MSTRVSNMSMHMRASNNVLGHMSKMSKLQDQMSSGKAFTKPSEDPASTVTAMRIRADQRINAQFERNIKDGLSWTTAVDDTIQNAGDMLNRVRDLTVQGANTGSYGPSELKKIAMEIRALNEGMVQLANTQISGRSIFAGTSNAPAAFTFDPTATPPSANFEGKAEGTVERRISEVSTVRVDADGAKVWGEGEDSMFAMLESLARTLETPDVDGKEVAKFLDKIDARHNAMFDELALIGTRHNQLTRAESQIGDAKVALEAHRSSVEDVNIAETITRLGLQEVAYQGSLSAVSRTLQPSLLDFLR